MFLYAKFECKSMLTAKNVIKTSNFNTFDEIILIIFGKKFCDSAYENNYL